MGSEVDVLAFPERISMQTSISIDSIPELKRIFEALGPGDELVFTKDNATVGKVSQGMPVKGAQRRTPGACKGMVIYMAPDFDAPLECMKEYME
jgi:hypothetical protein